MDTAILVDTYFKEGKKLIESLDKEGLKYPVAVWINTGEENDWNLVFGVHDLNKSGAKSSLKEIYKTIKANNLKISLNNISVVDLHSPLIKMLKNLIRTNSEINNIPLFGQSFEGQRFPDAIVYRVNL